MDVNQISREIYLHEIEFLLPFDDLMGIKFYVAPDNCIFNTSTSPMNKKYALYPSVHIALRKFHKNMNYGNKHKITFNIIMEFLSIVNK